MKCRQAYLFICDNLNANLNSARCREVRKHLAGCRDCTAFLDSVRKTVALYKAEPMPAVPARVHKSLLKTIDLAWETAPTPRRQRSTR
jgi:hypothetical protein